MADINIVHDPCDCPPEWCARFVEPPEHCINRLSGDVRTMKCPNHPGYTWHQDGVCLACKRDGHG